MTSESTHRESKCPVCLGQFLQTHLLPCSHTSCLQCMEGCLLALEDGDYALGCPVCQSPTPFSLDGPRDVPLPTPHPQPRPIPMTDRTCSGHNQTIKIYCETCQSLICNLCAIESHQNHDYFTISHSYNKHWQAFRTESGSLKLKVSALENAVDRLMTREKAITTNGREIIEEIHSFADRLIGIVKQTKTDLTSRVNKITQKKLNVLALQREEANAILKEAAENLHKMDTAMNTQAYEFLSDMNRLSELAETISTIDTQMYQPVELADIKLRGNGALLVHCKNLGTVASSSVSHFCKPTHNKKSHVGINMTFDLEIRNNEDTPISLPTTLIRCNLIPPSDHDPIPCPISSPEPGSYRVGYTPTQEGVHHMKIVICGEEIPDGPFVIPVSGSPNQADKKAIFAVTGLQRPWGVGINQQYIVVAEASAHRLTLLSREGERVRTLGSKGKEDGKFTEPRGVVIAPSNNTILVTDYDRVQKLSAAGQCLRTVCGKGMGPLQFDSPRGLALHPVTAKVYVADCNNHRVQVLHPDLSFSHSFGRPGSGEGEFRFPWDVACEERFVYVVDNENHTVHKYTPEGEFVLRFGSKGSLPGQLNWPSSIAIAGGKLYVTDDNNRVSVFDCQGNFLEFLANEENPLSPFALKHPLGIVVDESGKIHVSDCWNNRLLIL